MNDIKGVAELAGPRLVQSEAAEAVSEATEATAAAEAGAVDPTTALFDKILAEASDVGGLNHTEAVQRAVEEMLSASFPEVPEAARAEMVEEIAASMLADPDLSARLERLLGPAG